MIIPWYIYLFFSIILLSCYGLFHRSLLKDDDSSPQAQTMLFLGLGGILAIIIAIVQGKFNLAFPSGLIWNFLLVILLLTPAYLFKYRGYQLIGASEVVIFSVTGRLWNIFGAWLFLHETVTLKVILGGLLVLAGAMLSCYERGKFLWSKGVIVVLISAILFGFGDINGFYILRSYDSSNFLIYSYLLPVLALLILQPKTVLKLRYYLHKGRAWKMGVLSLCDTLGMLTLYLAYQVGGNASIISPLRSTSIILTVLLAAIFLNERNNLSNKIIGAIVAVIGIILLL